MLRTCYSTAGYCSNILTLFFIRTEGSLAALPQDIVQRLLDFRMQICQVLCLKICILKSFTTSVQLLDFSLFGDFFFLGFCFTFCSGSLHFIPVPHAKRYFGFQPTQNPPLYLAQSKERKAYFGQGIARKSKCQMKWNKIL